MLSIICRNGSIDRDACESVIETARPLPVTFHRAIDVAFDWKSCLEEAIELGFKAVLTSGQEPTALDGVHVIRQMQDEYSKRIDVLVGCGVNSSNVANLVEWTRCQWYHASASVVKNKVVSPTTYFSDLPHLRRSTKCQWGRKTTNRFVSLPPTKSVKSKRHWPPKPINNRSILIFFHFYPFFCVQLT